MTEYYFDKNLHGFTQKRVLYENLKIEPIDEQKSLGMPYVLNPPGISIYGKVSKYLGIDCEMDLVCEEEAAYLGSMKGKFFPCKVSVINEKG
jgi:hypothetical protein